jgi:hypothetical protein
MKLCTYRKPLEFFNSFLARKCRKIYINFSKELDKKIDAYLGQYFNRMSSCFEPHIWEHFWKMLQVYISLQITTLGSKIPGLGSICQSLPCEKVGPQPLKIAFRAPVSTNLQKRHTNNPFFFLFFFFLVAVPYAMT